MTHDDLIARLRAVLREHHEWHLAQDRDGDEWGIDPVDAYSESGLCERTGDALTADAGAQGEAVRRGIYIASKAKYGGEWLEKRAAGYPVSATWIDQFEPGTTEDWPALWTACVDEVKSSAALVLICRPGDVLKGAFVEAGAALAVGVPVFAVGIADYSIRHHPGVTECETEAQAFIAAYAATFKPSAPPADPVREAARVLLADLALALDTDMRPEGREAGRRWSKASDAAEAAPTYMTRPTPIQMIRAALRILAALEDGQ